MKLGDRVRIRECDPIPEVVGQHAKVVDLQIQPYERYRQYPIWVKVMSGEREGRVYGFHEGEVELLPTMSETQIRSREQEVKANETESNRTDGRDPQGCHHGGRDR